MTTAAALTSTRAVSLLVLGIVINTTMRSASVNAETETGGGWTHGMGAPYTSSATSIDVPERRRKKVSEKGDRKKEDGQGS
jgi:hypothetical protein